MPWERHYEVHVHSEGGGVWAEVPELPGCRVSGDSIEDLWMALEQAISRHLSEDGRVVHIRLVDLEPLHDGRGRARVVVDA